MSDPASPEAPEDGPASVVPVLLLPEDDDAEPVPVGTVLFGPGGELLLEDADPAHEALLREALARVNGKAAIALRSTAPMEAEDAVGAVEFTRGSPGFDDAVRGFLERFYGLRLG